MEVLDASLFVIEENRIDLLGIDWMKKLGSWDIKLNTSCISPSTNSALMNEDTFNDKLVDFVSTSIVTLRDEFSIIVDGNLETCSKMNGQLFTRSGTKPSPRPKQAVPLVFLDGVNKELGLFSVCGHPGCGKNCQMFLCVFVVTFREDLSVK